MQATALVHGEVNCRRDHAFTAPGAAFCLRCVQQVNEAQLELRNIYVVDLEQRLCVGDKVRAEG